MGLNEEDAVIELKVKRDEGIGCVVSRDDDQIQIIFVERCDTWDRS